LSNSSNESKALVLRFKDRPLSAQLEPYSHFRVFDKLYNPDSGVLFYVPIWLNTAQHSYPNPGLKSSVWWYDSVGGLYSVVRFKDYVGKYVGVKVVGSFKSLAQYFYERYVSVENLKVRLLLKIFDSDVLRAKSVDSTEEKREKKRGFNPIFVEAKRIVRSANVESGYKDGYIEGWEYLFGPVLNEVTDLAYEYDSEVKDRVILLIDQYWDWVLVIKYITRFSPEYLESVRAELLNRAKWINRIYNKTMKATFITLTVRVRDYYSLQELMDNVVKMFNKFITHLKYYVDIKDYVRFVEIGKEHNVVHFHVLVINPLGFIDRDIVQSCWSVGETTVGNVDLVYFDSVSDGVQYALKYITKLIKIDRDQDLRNQLGFKLLALLWATSKRLFSVSEKFTALMNKHKLIEEIVRLFDVDRNMLYKLVYNPEIKKHAKSYREFKELIVRLLLLMNVVSLDLLRLTQKILWSGLRWFRFRFDVLVDPGLCAVGKWSGLDPPLWLCELIEYNVRLRWFYVGAFDPAQLPLSEGVYKFEDVFSIVEPLVGGV